MGNVVHIKISKKEIQKLPRYIYNKLVKWIDLVETYGIEEVRKIPSYHDEPLKGQRKGQRSIRLNIAYRAIYEEENGEIIILLEANKHDY